MLNIGFKRRKFALTVEKKVKYGNIDKNVTLNKEAVKYMASNAVNKLISAEKEAALKISEARERAKKIIAEAEKESRELLVNAEAAAEREVKELLIKADNDALGASDDILARAAEADGKLKALAEGRMEKAAMVITERVVNG